MEEDVSDFINDTSKKIAKIEKKIKEMKINIVILSFYTDLKLIEDSILSYESQGIKIDEVLYEKIEKFKILLHSKRDLPALGRKFIEVTEEFYKVRKQVNGRGKQEKKRSNKIIDKNSKDSDSIQVEEFLLAYC